MQANTTHETPLLTALEQLAPHNHLCTIYESSEERFAVAIPFIRFGLDRGQKCIYIADDGTEAAVRDAMYAGGIDVERAVTTHSLVLKKKETTYLKHGSFDPEWMFSFWSEATAEAISQGFSALRATGETEWVARGAPGLERWMEYESRVTHMLAQYNCVVLCQYNRQLFPPELILDVIRTHPLVVCGAVVCKNPYYVPCDEFLKPNQASREVERLLDNILTVERDQQALRRSEDRFRHIIDTIPTMVWSLRPDGAVDFLNQVWLNYTGVSLQEGLEEPNRVVHPDDLPRVLKKWLADMAVGEPFEDEMRLRRADGEYRWFLVRTVPLRDEAGNIVKWYGSSTDIADRRRAAEALRASEERWRAVFENSAVGIALVDPLGKYLGSNRAYQEMVGYTDEELRALSYLDITYEEDRELNRALSVGLWEGKRRQFQLEKRYRRKDGNLIWARATISAATGTEGRPRFGMGIVEDITERKRAEEALRRSEAYLAAGQRLSHTGSWALDLSSRELYWSQETYRIFGFDPASTSASVDKTFLPRIHPEDRPKVGEGLKAAAAQKEEYELDYRIVLPDGSIKYIRDVVYPVTGEVGEVVERYGVIMDVTERKQTEEELQRSRDQLRALAARLQAAREEERTKVAREIHDELGQALTAIKIDLSSLSRELPADKKPESESILKLADETIQSVRRISTELRPAILDAVGLVAAVEWAAGEFEGRTGTSCQLDLPQEDIAIDQERATALFRIFQETLTNVVRHANATVVSVRLAKEDNNLTLRVHDNGTGVSEEQLSAGSSLGILGIRERALLLGGELTITGGPGEGTTVRVRIPETLPPKDIK